MKLLSSRDGAGVISPARHSGGGYGEDLVILASALEGKADVLVTGDKELLALGSIKDLEIISPRQFWAEVLTTLPPSNPPIITCSGTPEGNSTGSSGH